MTKLVLVHGSCHGAWCWRDMIAPLTQSGHDVVALDLPSHGDDPTPVNTVTLDSYAQAIASACTPDTVLVGHSMGGYAITAAAELAPQNIAQLIYLAAYVPVSGASLADMRRMAPSQPFLPAVVMAQDAQSFTVDAAKAPALFYHDCSDAQVAYALARLGPQARLPTETALTLTQRSAAIPRAYIRCTDDRTIPPAFQRTMTTGWPARTVVDMDTSHSPFFSSPNALAAHIEALSPQTRKG